MAQLRCTTMSIPPMTSAAGQNVTTHEAVHALLRSIVPGGCQSCRLGPVASILGGAHAAASASRLSRCDRAGRYRLDTLIARH